MKEKKPTKRDISKILMRRVEGYNDKRKGHNRIKLTEQLTYREMSTLESELSHCFPEYRFAIGDIRWCIPSQPVQIVTAIRFWK
jgi:hypothetical protein